MKVFEIMSDRVATIEPDAPAATARALMQTKGIHHLAVVRDGELQGVLSSHDITAEAVTGGQRSVLVSDLMQRHVVTIGRNVPVSKAATLMGGRAIGSVIVTDRRKVVGIITVSDLLELVARGGMRQPKRAARPILGTRVPHRKQHRAGGAW
jgi:CBS domain-containing protein